MNIPSLAPIPPATVQSSIMPKEWELCMDAWLILTQQHLLTSVKSFNLAVAKDSSLPQFLISYVKNAPGSPDAKARDLRKTCFLLIHRIFSDATSVPSSLIDWGFWVDLSLAYPRSKALSRLLGETWIKKSMDTNSSMSRYKSTLTRALDVGHLNPELEDLLPKTMALLRSCYPYGQFLMLGSDFVDALASAYKAKPRLQKKIVIIAYFSFLSLMESERPRISTLLDHLYSLNSSTSHPDSLLKGLIGSTPLLQKLRTQISGPEAGRVKSLLESLKGFETTADGRAKKPIRRKVEKGKGKFQDHYGQYALDTMHVHKLSLISQIQDLFPDLGSGFIMKLLDEYNEDTEQITAHLLDDSLPAHLKQADHSEPMKEAPHHNTPDLAPDLSPRPTPPLLPTRRNVYDDDDFDRLAISTSQVHLGKDESKTPATLQPATDQKAAILSALATFDPDDDERDDTYDVEDVGGTVDTTNAENAADLKQDVHEEALFNAYSMSPGVFNRDAETKRGKGRAELKSETGMTDEAIEGWGIMIGRDPRRLERLKRKFEMGPGGQQQRVLEGTAWRGDLGTENSDAMGVGRGGKGGRGRGRGGGKSRGDVLGPADDRGTQVARQRKDASKGSRANHNRRDQRAKKIARGGFAG